MSSERPSGAELRETYTLPGSDDDLQEECDVTWFRASGPGGQHRNRTMTAVRLHHRPSGLVLIGRRERSARRNLKDALDRLRRRLEELLTPPRPRRATRPSRASRERRVTEKRRRSKVKKERSGKDWD